jgi:hypothetical protein
MCYEKIDQCGLNVLKPHQSTSALVQDLRCRAANLRQTLDDMELALVCLEEKANEMEGRMKCG